MDNAATPTRPAVTRHNPAVLALLVEASKQAGDDGKPAIAPTYSAKDCKRCKGTGSFPSREYNGVCFGCGGKGKPCTNQKAVDIATMEARLANCRLAWKTAKQAESICVLAADTSQTKRLLERIVRNGKSLAQAIADRKTRK